VVVDGASVYHWLGATTMLAITLVVGLISLGKLCRVLFALAVHALPFFIAVSMSLSILNAGSDLGTAVLIGLVAGMLTAAVGRVVFLPVHR
jgi:hypothetical protein